MEDEQEVIYNLKGAVIIKGLNFQAKFCFCKQAGGMNGNGDGQFKIILNA